MQGVLSFDSSFPAIKSLLGPGPDLWLSKSIILDCASAITKRTDPFSELTVKSWEKSERSAQKPGFLRKAGTHLQRQKEVAAGA